MKAILATALTAFLLIGSTAVIESDTEAPKASAPDSQTSAEYGIVSDVLTRPAADGTFWQSIDLGALDQAGKNTPIKPTHQSSQNYLLRLVAFYAVFLLTVFSFSLIRVLRNAP